MPIHSTVTLTRTRVLLDTADVEAITTALVTGMPVPMPLDDSDVFSPHYTVHEAVYEQWILRDYARFPLLDKDRTLADMDVVGTWSLLSGAQDVYLDFVTLAYRGTVTHAAATVWRTGSGSDFHANDSLYLGRGFIDGAFFTSTKTAPRTRGVPPGESVPEPDHADLARALFDPGFSTGPMRVPFMRLYETATVHTTHGPDINDRAWDEPMPRYGTDLTFDAAHPGAIRAEYMLIHHGQTNIKDEP